MNICQLNTAVDYIVVILEDKKVQSYGKTLSRRISWRNLPLLERDLGEITEGRNTETLCIWKRKYKYLKKNSKNLHKKKKKKWTKNQILLQYWRFSHRKTSGERGSNAFNTRLLRWTVLVLAGILSWGFREILSSLRFSCVSVCLYVGRWAASFVPRLLGSREVVQEGQLVISVWRSAIS